MLLPAKVSMSVSSPEARKCALCGKPQNPAYRPFCSRRCADIDLGRWLKGGYAIPARPEDETGDPAPAADQSPEDE